VARLSELLAGIVGLTAIISAAQSSRAEQSRDSGARMSAAAEGEIQEIVVTAERRKERLQDVPLSVAVITAADAVKMGNSTNLSLSTQVPGFGRGAILGIARAASSIRNIKYARSMAGQSVPRHDRRPRLSYDVPRRRLVLG
jgi:hypothetical protein